MTDLVTGVPRTDSFLKLDDAGLALRDRVIAETLRLHYGASDDRDWRALGVSLQPRVGDLVLELTRASWTKDPKLKAMGFGYLVARTGETWHVQYGPDEDDICAWGNAMFIRVPAAALTATTN